MSGTGRFTLGNLNNGDTIRISYIGYKPHYLVFSQPVSDTIRVYLDQDFKALKNVIIMGKRNDHADSIRLRKEFANIFDHKAPTFKDIFVTRSPYTYTPNDYIAAVIRLP